MSPTSPAPSVTEILAERLLRPVDAGARARASLHFLDWLGCALAGAASATGQVFRRAAREAPAGPARILGGPSVAVKEAAFANGAFGNVLEMDDVHRGAILHPGPVVAPTVLALAEARGLSGHALLDALVAGYEAEIRIGRALGPAHYARFHNTATMGPFGAAAAAGRLIGLGADRLVDALGNAGTQAAGLWRCRHEPVMTKQLHTARAAQTGLEAALLAAHGLTGPRFILEGAQGFFFGLAPDGDVARVLAEPEADWLVHETSFKPWPACRHCHPAIDAALALRTRLGGREIAAIEVATYADGVTFCDRAAPATPIEAKFSFQHAVAMTLLDGPPPLAAFEPAAIARPDAAALRARTRVVTDPVLTARYPARFGAGLAVTFADGTRLEETVPDALGDPENPLSAPGILAKAMTLMMHAGLAEPAARALCDAALALSENAPVARLSALLPGPDDLKG